MPLLNAHPLVDVFFNETQSHLVMQLVVNNSLNRPESAIRQQTLNTDIFLK